MTSRQESFVLHTLIIQNPTVGFDRISGDLSSIHFTVTPFRGMNADLRLNAQDAKRAMRRLAATTMNEFATYGRAIVRIDGCTVTLVKIVSRFE